MCKRTSKFHLKRALARVSTSVMVKLTAAHVVSKGVETVTFENGGTFETRKVEDFKEYDISILEVEYDGYAAKLSCDYAPVGTPIEVYGNPYGMEICTRLGMWRGSLESLQIGKRCIR